ncbi:DUF2637 domain-containing protein [Streptosporangium sp. NPDC051022]|uniref:DUF2637 domain-containing protein n=1 Tax=Streptosporangium sp. NPDC051022 TaxID=3155752 RepID=UPI003426B65C
MKKNSKAALSTDREPPRTTSSRAAGDRHIRGWSIATIVMVAVVGTAISSWHAFELVRGSGEPWLVAAGYPLLIDGVIFMASMVILMCSRRRLPAPWLAWVALFAGALVTLAVNVAHGWNGGILSRLVSAIPPLAVLGSYELLMRQIRMAALLNTPAPEAVTETVDEVPVSHPEPAVEEVAEPAAAPAPIARTLEAAILAARAEGESIRGLARAFDIPRSRVESILKEAARDGDGPDSESQEHKAAAPVAEPTSVPSADGASRSDVERHAEPPADPADEDEYDAFPPVLAQYPIDRETLLRTGLPVSVNGHGPAGGA